MHAVINIHVDGIIYFFKYMFQEKCYPYWYPKGKVLLADSLSINVLHEKVYAFYTTRNIKIEDREVIASMYFTFCISIKIFQKRHDFIFSFNSGIQEMVIRMLKSL